MDTTTTTAPVKQRQQRVKPARLVRLLIRPLGRAPGVVRLRVGKATADYYLFAIPADFGIGFRVVKIGLHVTEGEYAVNIDGPKRSCECKGFLRHGLGILRPSKAGIFRPSPTRSPNSAPNPSSHSHGSHNRTIRQRRVPDRQHLLRVGRVLEVRSYRKKDSSTAHLRSSDSHIHLLVQRSGHLGVVSKGDHRGKLGARLEHQPQYQHSRHIVCVDSRFDRIHRICRAKILKSFNISSCNEPELIDRQ